jgi:hypothetical protein
MTKAECHRTYETSSSIKIPMSDICGGFAYLGKLCIALFSGR